MADLDSLAAIFKAYDVRGTVPDQLDAGLAERIGAAFARFVADTDGADRVLVARDMRPSGVELAAAFAEGVQRQGLDVVDLGLASTDMVYFAAGTLDAPGAMFTASHNPAQYNGIKMCLAGARPIGEDTGLGEIRALAYEGVPAPPESPGRLEEADLLGDFARHVRSFVDVDALTPLRVVADTANGMGGLVVPPVFASLPFDLEMMYGELDGTFPNHPADPIQPENLRDLQARVRESGADVGLAFDGDADRVFLVDDQGEPLSGSTTTAIVAKGILEKQPGCDHPLQPDLLEGGARGDRRERRHAGAHPCRALVHQGGDGRDRRRVRRRALCSLLLPRQLPGRLGQHRRPGRARADLPGRRAAVDAAQALRPLRGVGRDQHDRRRRRRGHRAGVGRVRRRHAGSVDGLTVDLGDWWFNLRPSNTEPLLRLNLEAPTREACDAHVAEVRALITDEG